MREAHAQALAAGRPPVAAHHVGLGPSFVDEDQPRRVKVDLAVEPGLSALQDVRAILLARVRRLFLRVMPWRLKNRWIVP
jgi:hypothetical protein